MKCESGSSRIQPGEGPSRGLLRDYEPSDGTFSSTTEWCVSQNCAATLTCRPAAAPSHPGSGRCPGPS